MSNQPFQKNDDPDYAAVLASYHRCEAVSDFFDTFYERFFAKSPEVPPKFARTNMDRQKQVIMASLLWVLRLYTGDPIAKTEIEKLSETHKQSGYDIKPELYDLWLDALCESFARHDPEYTPELEQRIRRVVQPAIDLMRSRYRS